MAPRPAARGRGLKRFIRDVISFVIDDDCPDLAAQMSYYFVLAIFPFLIFLAAMVGFLPFTNLWASIVEWMMLYLPRELRQSMLRTVLDLTSGRTSYLSFGLLGTSWAASSGFVALMESLSVAYGVKETRGYWQKRLVALLTLFAASGFFLVCFALMSMGHWLGVLLANRLGTGRSFILFWDIGRWAATLLLLNLGIGLMDYALPNVRRPWRWITPGTAVAVLFSVLATLGFDAYALHFSIYAHAYSALLSFILLVLWIYVASFILLIGAEINSVWEGTKQSASRAAIL
jgi:membrane protein